MSQGIDYDECTDDEICKILGGSYIKEVKEWVIDHNGQPCCTAFVEVGQPIPEPRCELTIDMFEGKK